MKLYLKFIYFAFIYSISNNKWVLVESSDISASGNPSHEGDKKAGGSDSGLAAQTAGGADGGSLRGVSTQCVGSGSNDPGDDDASSSGVASGESTDAGLVSVSCGVDATDEGSTGCGWSCFWSKLTGSCSSCGSCNSCNNCGRSCSWDKVKGWLCCNSCGSCKSSKPKSGGDNSTDADSTSGGDASLASTDASPEGSVAAPANEASTSGGSSGEGAGADADSGSTSGVSLETSEKKSRCPSWLGWCGSSCCSGSDANVDLTSDGDINIKSHTKSTDKFDYNKVGNYVTYTSKGDNAFKHVKDDDATIWDAEDDSNCSTKVEVEHMSNDSKAVTVFLGDDKTKLFMKSGKSDPWNEIDLSQVNPRSINIDFPYESYFYTNTLVDGVRTFEAKTGFAFNGACVYINDKRVEIWKAEDQSDYVKKIDILKGKKLIIYVDDKGNAKVIDKGSDGKWPGDGSG